MGASAVALSSTRRSAHWLDAIADPVRLQILRTLSRTADATASELASRSQASYQTVRRHLDALETSGVVEAHPGHSDGETFGRPPTRFSLAPAVRDDVRAAFGDSG